ncbi:hypothetical protein LG298_09310 [Cytobacillus firmus]|uniref:DUF6115 domain-containing protein n=1 Tax=Cytobacillus firmus TaxID=1399 RepID=UPI00384D2B99
MKEENDDFISKLSKANAKNDTSIKEKSIPVNLDRKNELDIAKADEKSMPLARASIYQASKAYKQNLRAAEDKLSEKERLPSLKENESVTQSDSSQSIKEENPPSINDQVFILKKQGMSAGDIAKKLGKGKTEVELMLKFRQNQQE